MGENLEDMPIFNNKFQTKPKLLFRFRNNRAFHGYGQAKVA